MILISHRGNLDGSNPKNENTQEYIQEALDSGFHVEIDIWRKNNKLFLGHNKPENEVEEGWLLDRREKLWVHAKNPEALFYLTYSHLSRDKCLCVFFHENERYAIIQNGRNEHGILVDGLIWAHDTTNLNSKCIIPVLHQMQWNKLNHPYHPSIKIPKQKIWGICSDYVSELQIKLQNNNDE